MAKSIIVKTFFGCCTSMFLMEILMSRQPSLANLVTFLQFLFPSVTGFIFTSKFGTVPSKIPIVEYLLLVALFFVTSVVNNFVYSLHVPSTLHMIIRSASLPASLLVSWIFMNRRPRLCRVVGSLLVTGGVALATYAGAAVVKEESTDLKKYCLGVGLLFTTLFSGAFTGMLQERLHKIYGSHSEEMLFYTCALPLPCFIFIYPSIKAATSLVNTTWNYGVGWILITFNILAQYLCSKSVHNLATVHNSVTITLILTIRKFVSLLISAVVFQSKFTFLHFIGTLLVMLGTVIYFDFFGCKQSQSDLNKLKKNS